jgi:flagellar hook-associated protein 2
MAEGILGLGSSGANGLTQELIDKLKTAETKAQIEPYSTSLENWETELEKIDAINVKVTELLTAMTDFDLNKNGSNAFEQVIATTTGTSTVFDALDISGLIEGTTSVNVTQLAQKDVYQTATFTDKTALITDGQDVDDSITVEVQGFPEYQSDIRTSTYTDLVGAGTISIAPNGGSNIDIVTTATTTWSELKDLINAQTELEASFVNERFVIKSSDDTKTLSISDTVGTVSADLGISRGRKFTTVGETYENLAKKINSNSKLTASVEAISDTNNRIVIKSSNSGTSNDLTLNENGVNFGLTQTLNAQNMNATADGVTYDVSSNSINIQGSLTMTAIELGASTISIKKDDSQVIPKLNEIVSKYNELVDLVDAELYSSDSEISDASSLRLMMSQIKDKFFGNYGNGNDLNLFAYGFDLDRTGHMRIDEEVLSKKLVNNTDDIKLLFIGTTNDVGLGTELKAYLDDLDSLNGLMTNYGKNMITRKANLEKDKETAENILNAKYSQMSAEFAAYTAIITQMDAAFGGMKLMMEQSTAK